MNDVDFDRWLQSDPTELEPEPEQSLADALRYNLEVFENGFQIGRDLRVAKLELRGQHFVCKRRIGQGDEYLATWDVWLDDHFFGTYKVCTD